MEHHRELAQSIGVAWARVSRANLTSVSSWDRLTDWARTDGLVVVMLVSGTLLAVRLVRWSGHALATRGDRTSGAQARLETSVQALGWAFAAVAWSVCVALVLTRCNVPVASLIPAASVIGVGLGFGALRVVGDVLAGVFLLAERTYVVGDTIRVANPGELGGVTGRVEEVTLRVTRLRTFDGDLVTLPNSEVRQVANSSHGWSRIVVDVPVDDRLDLDAA
ncbi:MAG: MscS Mechanosensitive ion channel, partial [Acidimicrobiia bacterium]|nr:MscS Mechanosensitive ion channel [Acidimicrobiia bacterium]